MRDVSWIMDSVERVVRANPLEPSGLFKFDPGGTVYSRVGALAASDGLVGFALDALREAYFSPEAAGRLMLLTYETLVADPARALEAVYALPRPAGRSPTISRTSATTPTRSTGGWARRGCTGWRRAWRRRRGRRSCRRPCSRGSPAMRSGATGRTRME